MPSTNFMHGVMSAGQLCMIYQVITRRMAKSSCVCGSCRRQYRCCLPSAAAMNATMLNPLAVACSIIVLFNVVQQPVCAVPVNFLHAVTTGPMSSSSSTNKTGRRPNIESSRERRAPLAWAPCGGRHTVVVGAGAAGLAAAHFLQSHNCRSLPPSSAERMIGPARAEGSKQLKV